MPINVVSTSGHTMMTPRRYLRLVIVAALLLAVITIYVTFFRHPAPDKLMEINRRRGHDYAASFLGRDDGVKETHNKDEKTNRGANEEKEVDEDDDEDDKTMLKNKEDNQAVDDEEHLDQDEAGPKKKSGKKNVVETMKGKAQWDAFLSEHKYTSVGVVFDKCEKPTTQLGTVILLPDEEFGGVKTRTFYNLTLEEDLKGGTFNIEVKYNGQDLYDNWWEICEMEDDLEPEKRTFTCPIRKGLNKFVKDKHIPGYLPEGRYLSKAWVKTEAGRLIACGFSDLTL